MVARIGIYFLLLGVFFLLLFCAGDEAGASRFRWFFLGLILTALGATLWWRNRPKSDAKQFRWFRRVILKEDQDKGK